ncbi:MAG: hypothetical protein HQM03_07640 [Magnetococcales bacterium]|nr:hypothetical protein [Magnetococcales bacterium]
MVAVSASCLWLIHPFNISTTLYIIQRSTQLSTLFLLLAMLVYLHGRRRLLEGQGNLFRGYLRMSGSVVLGGILATYSKENGALLPLFILVMEGTLLQRTARPTGWRIWRALFLLTPLLLLCLLIGSEYNLHIVTPANEYNYNLREHILTDFVVLADYLRQIALPSMARMGLTHDDYPVSHGLLDPVHTLPAMLLILAMLGSALLWRKSRPTWAFGVLWFFAGHTLESTILPLHLYFEHRNYLPAMGIWYAVASGFFRFLAKQEIARLRPFLTICGLLYCLLLGSMTRSESTLWGNAPLLAFAWSQQHPTSHWAQGQLATILIMQNQPFAVLEIYKKLLKTNPGNKVIYIDWMRLACHFQEIPAPDLHEVRKTYHSTNMHLPALDLLIDNWLNGTCKNLKKDFILEILAIRPTDAAWIPAQYFAALEYFTALVHHKDNNPELALTHIDAAMRLHPMSLMVFKKMEWLIGMERHAEALRTLETDYSGIRSSPLIRQYELERIENMKKKIKSILDKK